MFQLFVAAWRASFISSCRVSLMMNALNLWENLSLAFIFEGQLCQVNSSWLAVYFLSILWMYHATLFRPARFVLRNLLIASSGYLRTFFFFLAAFKILSLFLILDSFNVMFLREDVLGLNHLGELWASWSWIFKLFPGLGSSQPLVM